MKRLVTCRCGHPAAAHTGDGPCTVCPCPELRATTTEGDTAVSEPSKFRKKPVVIEASEPLTEHNAADIAVWAGGKVETLLSGHTRVIIHTLEGDMTAVMGDRVIRGVQGEFYPCKPDIFDATYEPVVAGGARDGADQ